MCPGEVDMKLNYDRERTRSSPWRFVWGGIVGAVCAIPSLVALLFLQQGKTSGWAASAFTLLMYPVERFGGHLTRNENAGDALVIMGAWACCLGFIAGSVCGLAWQLRHRKRTPTRGQDPISKGQQH